MCALTQLWVSCGKAVPRFVIVRVYLYLLVSSTTRWYSACSAAIFHINPPRNAFHSKAFPCLGVYTRRGARSALRYYCNQIRWRNVLIAAHSTASINSCFYAGLSERRKRKFSGFLCRWRLHRTVFPTRHVFTLQTFRLTFCVGLCWHA